jgi:hypothetical protein
VRNPLATLKVLVEGAQRTKNASPLSRQELTVMHGEIARLERIVQKPLRFLQTMYRLPPARHMTIYLRQNCH